MERRRKNNRVQEHIDSFISDSTLHGLHFCFDKKHLVRRIVWTLILLAAFGYVSEKLYASVEEFFKYPMSTTTTVIYENNMAMPAISFCNRNDFRKSVVEGSKLQKIFDGHLGYNAVTVEEYRNIVENSNHRLQDMLIATEGGDTISNFENFTTFWASSGTGKCYTYNSGKIGPIMTKNKTGDRGSFSFVFNVEQYEYDKNTQNAGLRLILHGQSETPVKTPGLLLSPGFETNVAVRKRKVGLLILLNLDRLFGLSLTAVKVKLSDQSSFLGSCSALCGGDCRVA